MTTTTIETTKQITNKLDRTKTSLNERMESVNNALDTEFYTNYFSENFNGYLTKNDDLSDKNNVCKSLESIANYLLASDEVKKEDKLNNEYSYAKNFRDLEKKISRETSLQKLSESAKENSKGEKEDFESMYHRLKQNETNLKIVKAVTATPADLKRNDELSKVLNDYNDLLEVITAEIKNPNSVHDRFTLTRLKGEIKRDMNEAKKSLLRIVGEHFNPMESTKYDVDLFDLGNVKHLIGMKMIDSKGKKHVAKGLLFLPITDDLTNDFNLLLLELQQYIDTADLTDLQREVATLIKAGLPNKEVAEMLNITIDKFNSSVRTIARKVAKVAEKEK